jgi:hypothetical protein
VLGHAAGNVGVVMLDRDAAEAIHFLSELRAEVAGMEIVRNDGGLDVEEAGHAFQGFFEEAEGLEVFEVTEMLAGQGESRAGEAEGIFLLGAAGQDLGLASPKPDGLRSISTGASEEHGFTGNDTHYGVVDAGVNTAVVVGESVGDAG